MQEGLSTGSPPEAAGAYSGSYPHQGAADQDQSQPYYLPLVTTAYFYILPLKRPSHHIQIQS